MLISATSVPIWVKVTVERKIWVTVTVERKNWRMMTKTAYDIIFEKG